MSADWISTAYLAFLAYGFIGWAYESTIWAKAEKKRFINRGMLVGPICPIYGVVSFMDWELLHGIENPVMIFFVAGIVCCIFEYVISWTLERIFHQRWWDYSNYPLNLNGRISLPSGLFFGAAGLLLVKVVHPFTIGTVAKIPLVPRYWISGVLFLLFLADIIGTSISIGLKNPPKRIKGAYDRITYRTAQPFEFLNEAVVPLDRYRERMIRTARVQAKRMERTMKQSGEKIRTTLRNLTDGE